MRRTKSEKGITIVALIITIIVLLILATVAIQAISGEGMIEKAKEAKEKTESSQIIEILKLALMEDMIGNSNSDVSIDKKKNYYILTYNNIEYLYDIKNKQITEYNNTLAYYIENKAISTGDYIDYNQGIGLNTQDGLYVMTTKETGFDKDQTFNVTSYDGKWQILYDGDEEYGVQIISTENILKNEEQDVLILKRKRWL